MGRGSFFVLAAVFAAPAASAQMQVLSTSPANNAGAPAAVAVSVTFDRAVNPATVTASTFRVFGRVSGTKTGPFAFSNGNQTVTLTPGEAFAAGETVLVNLSNAITGQDATPLRSAGYAFGFGVQTQPAGLNFQQIDVLSNLGPDPQTRIYGAMSADLNNDGYADLTTVNEVSGDLRVFLNRADGSGLYFPYLTPPLPIGIESSPNEPADFDNDGNTDIAVSSADDDVVSIALGNGDGTFAAPQNVAVGNASHGVAVLDVDGDADLDVVNANFGSDNLSLALNDGGGGFGAASFFDSGTSGEYGLAAGDLNNDGITDLIVGANSGQQVRGLLGNGNGTFTPAAAQSSGGNTWVVFAGDVDGDGNLDVAAANAFSGNVGVLRGNGDGTFDPPAIVNVGSHIPSVDLGDLDGDGDADMVISSFAGGFWRVFTNDGSGGFTFDQEISAPSNPSCSVLVDIDNDGDLDMALTDEIADVVVLMKNGPLPPLACPPVPQSCREPTIGGKAVLKLKDDTGNDAKDQILWKWTKGAATAKGEFGDPLNTDHYALCVYDAGALAGGASAEAGGSCGVGACWLDQPAGYLFKDRDADPFGALKVQLRAGADGAAKILFRAKGVDVDMPPVATMTGPVEIQLINGAGSPCWAATYSTPFIKHDGVVLKDKAD